MKTSFQPDQIRSKKDLKELQRLMARTVMSPLTSTDRMRPKTSDGKSNTKSVNTFIKPNDRLTAFERLEIYNRQYWFRLQECFYDDFPGLRSVLGETRFRRISKAYLENTPSRSFTLRNLGQRLPAWLKKHPKFLGPNPRLALDMVALEWAHIEAFDLEAKKPFPLQQLEGKSPERIYLRLQPYLQLLELEYPVDNRLLLAKSGAAGEKVASNAINEPKKSRTKLKSNIETRPERVYLAVHRLDNTVFYKRLGREAFQFLVSLQQGKNLVQATLAAFRGSRCPIEDRPALIQKCVAHAATMTWFCEK